MILDTLENARNYSCLHERFGAAIEFLKTQAPFLDCGRYELDLDNLYVNIVEVDLKNAKDAKLEAHDQYIDVQAVIKGRETYGYAFRGDCDKPTSEMDTVKDIMFFEDAAQTFFTVNQGQFMIFFPTDAHAPLIGNGKVVKAIAKVRL